MSPSRDCSPTHQEHQTHIDGRIVSFAPCAVVVQDIDLPSTASSESFPSADGKPHGRRGSDQIKIDSILAQAADEPKHTLKARPLTPFVKFTGGGEEEPLTAEVNAEFEVKDVSSVVDDGTTQGSTTSIVKDIEMSATLIKDQDPIAQPILSVKV
ncbi:hypothetical protein NliqN6_1406 [Naganishia liquefaciens]|uniref:Uncharacterized protein n=1 Tax=Naganishia liquefaciens TaxID=104408 RepID=A0A8H3TQA4_9TREE|nr:hypothetical protein NliqN6_1406 [Naganishia liquefaciens]